MVKEKIIDSFLKRKRSDCQANESEPATKAAFESETQAVDEPEPESRRRNPCPASSLVA